VSESGKHRTGSAAPPSAREIWVRLLLYPGHTLPTAAAPVLVAVGLAIHDGVFVPLPALVGFLGSWLIHVGGVFADNLALLRRHPDVREHPELSDAVASGALDLDVLRRATVACFVVGAAPGVWLAWIGGPFVIVIGCVGVLASLAYAATRLRYARFGLADPFFFLMFGVVAEVGTYYVQVASRAEGVWRRPLVSEGLPLEIFLVGLPVGALVTNVLVIDDVRDRGFDAVKGWRTTAVRFGLRGSRIEYGLLSALAWLAPFALWRGLDLGATVLLPLLALPLAVPIARAVFTKESTADLLPMTPRASLLSCVYGALLGLGLALGGA
jgi:1,4-dihydroxy-2-naphthoate octaprenyltransferase